MTPKDLFSNKSFCPLPWTGFHVDADGRVKNCICSFESIGNLNDQGIHEILAGEKNTQIKHNMLAGIKPYSCEYCYSLEENKTNRNIVSSRIYYIKELKTVNLDTYNSSNNFDLNHVDLRWQNTCNFACLYCSPTYSSKWAAELKYEVSRPSDQRLAEVKDFIFSNITQLKNIYLAGGEPLLMTENEEFLLELLEKNPTVTLRVNTNLSKTKTKVFELLKQFTNVHWTVSVESTHEEFEYMRYGGVWKDFVQLLEQLKELDHKITFNMVYCSLNYKSIVNCIDYLKGMRFHNNSFILTAAFGPNWIDARHLPNEMLQSAKELFQDRLEQKPGFLLEDGYKNILTHLNKPFNRNTELLFNQLHEIDQRRGLDSSKIFVDLYKFKKELNYGKTI